MLQGREIKVLVNQYQEAGYKSVRWNATNNYGKPISAGMYFYKIRAGEFTQTRKMLLLKLREFDLAEYSFHLYSSPSLTTSGV